jgi:hypothetical protein
VTGVFLCFNFFFEFVISAKKDERANPLMLIRHYKNNSKSCEKIEREIEDYAKSDYSNWLSSSMQAFLEALIKRNENCNKWLL